MTTSEIGEDTRAEIGRLLASGRKIDAIKLVRETSGLDLRNYEGVMKGTKFGPMVIPGDPDASNLMALVDWRVSPQIRMPHGAKKLSTCDRDAIRHWILEGAKNN